jgi:uncharacterized protein YkwD
MRLAALCSVVVLLLAAPGRFVAHTSSLQPSEAAFPAQGQTTSEPIGRPSRLDDGKSVAVAAGASQLDFPEAELGITGHTLRDIESLERDCFEEVNRQRQGLGVRPLDLFANLIPVARYYSRRMADEGFFSHRDPDGRTVTDRVGQAGISWRALGENLASTKGYVNPVASSVHGWMDSPGHRGNILNRRYNHGAVGAWIAPNGTVYFTEIFLTS